MKIGTNAMCEIEAATGKGIAEVGRLLGDPATASITLLRTVFWGALKGHQPDITVEACSDLMDEVGMDTVGAMIGDAFSLAMPKPKKEKAAPVPPDAAAKAAA
jgi:hypothetical protein